MPDTTTKSIPAKLAELFQRFDCCERCANADNPLRHILGGGKFERPTFLFLFINPTHQNIASWPTYEGERRFPFLGVRHFYKLMAEAGFIDPALVGSIYQRGWQPGDEHAIEENWRRNGVYITNLVKCTQPHPENPLPQTIREDLGLLHQEIAAVNPEYIVTFGKLPFKVMTGKDILLRDVQETMRGGTYEPHVSLPILGKTFRVLPCYFPVGRGNPPKAKEILRHLRDAYS